MRPPIRSELLRLLVCLDEHRSFKLGQHGSR
jgi:hypothetical protein